MTHSGLRSDRNAAVRGFLQSSTPEELLDFMQEEAAIWGGIAQKAGLHIE